MSQAKALPDTWVSKSRNACANCNLRAGCLPAELEAGELAQFGNLVTPRHRVARGGTLYRAGNPLEALFVVRSGSLKSVVTDEEGRAQIMGFFLAGELLGLDGIGTDRHTCDAVALEDSQVCVIGYHQLEDLSRELTDLQRQFHRIMSREIGRGYHVMMLLGRMHAEERLATFLLNVSERLLARGYSPSQFLLRMTRDEIGSYLGMKLETVSRMFSRFQREHIVEVHGKDICLIDIGKLNGIMEGADADAPAVQHEAAAKGGKRHVELAPAPIVTAPH